jgi:hypothetical protein
VHNIFAPSRSGVEGPARSAQDVYILARVTSVIFKKFLKTFSEPVSTLPHLGRGGVPGNHRPLSRGYIWGLGTPATVCAAVVLPITGGAIKRLRLSRGSWDKVCLCLPLKNLGKALMTVKELLGRQGKGARRGVKDTLQYLAIKAMSHFRQYNKDLHKELNMLKWLL